MKDPMKTKKSLLIFAMVMAVMLLSAFTLSRLWHAVSPWSNQWDSLEQGPYVAAMTVEGVIQANNVSELGLALGYQHDWTLSAIDDLIEDPENKGLILFVDSPGGGVYESDELYLKLKEYQETTGRPYYAVMGSMAASGGYYISACADQIYANRNTWTGSIGVTMGTFFDLSEFLNRYGVKSVTVTAGRNKAMGEMTAPLTEEQRQILQGLVDEAYDQFTGIVADGRDLDLADTRALADGRIYTAKQAMDLGLIDVMGSRDEAYAAMIKEYQLKNVELLEISYVDHSFLGQILGSVKVPNLSSGDASAILDLVEEQSSMPISYLYRGF